MHDDAFQQTGKTQDTRMAKVGVSETYSEANSAELLRNNDAP